MNFGKALLVAIFLCGISTGWSASAPQHVVTSAVKAVDDLGRRVVLGDHKAAVDLMYPKWKQSMAKRKGGIEKLEAELEGIGLAMARNGVSIIGVDTVGVPRVHEVWPGKNHTTENPNYTRWVLLVPTVTEFRIMDMNAEKPKPYTIKSYGFQIAISEKDQLNWTFINGSDVKVSDLRAIFPSLPANLKLPPVKREQVK